MTKRRPGVQPQRSSVSQIALDCERTANAMATWLEEAWLSRGEYRSEWNDVRFQGESGAPDSSLIKVADERIRQCLEAAIDDLRSLGDLVRRRRRAAATVTRAVLEASAWANYLGDPDIDPSERARRAANDALYEMQERRTVLAAIGEEVASIDARENDFIEFLASIEAIPPARRYGRRRYVGKARPGSTHSIKGLLVDTSGRDTGQFWYRMVSAVAHASPHGPFLVSNMFFVPGQSNWDRDDEAAHLVALTIGGLGALWNATLHVQARWGTALDEVAEVVAAVLKRWYLMYGDQNDPEFGTTGAVFPAPDRG